MRKIQNKMATRFGVLALLMGMGLYGEASADAVLDCQVAKITAVGNRAKCLAKKETDLLKGKSYTPQQCEADFDTAIGAAGDLCRYIDNQDGTVNDLNTLLQWEKKETLVNSG